MKTPSTFLYDLEKKLTKSEKRYIKVQSGSGEKDYIQLIARELVQFQKLYQKIQDEEHHAYFNNIESPKLKN